MNRKLMVNFASKEIKSLYFISTVRHKRVTAINLWSIDIFSTCGRFTQIYVQHWNSILILDRELFKSWFVFPLRNFIDFESSKFVEENPNIAVYFKKRNRKPPRLVANYCKLIDYFQLGKAYAISRKNLKDVKYGSGSFFVKPETCFAPCQISLMELFWKNS